MKIPNYNIPHLDLKAGDIYYYLPGQFVVVTKAEAEGDTWDGVGLDLDGKSTTDHSVRGRGRRRVIYRPGDEMAWVAVGELDVASGGYTFSGTEGLEGVPMWAAQAWAYAGSQVGMVLLPSRMVPQEMRREVPLDQLTYMTAPKAGHLGMLRHGSKAIPRVALDRRAPEFEPRAHVSENDPLYDAEPGTLVQADGVLYHVRDHSPAPRPAPGGRKKYVYLERHLNHDNYYSNNEATTNQKENDVATEATDPWATPGREENWARVYAPYGEKAYDFIRPVRQIARHDYMVWSYNYNQLIRWKGNPAAYFYHVASNSVVGRAWKEFNEEEYVTVEPGKWIYTQSAGWMRILQKHTSGSTGVHLVWSSASEEMVQFVGDVDSSLTSSPQCQYGLREHSEVHLRWLRWVEENNYDLNNEAATNQQENDMADEKGKFRTGVEKTFSASKRVAFEAGATALTNTANKELVAEVANVVEDFSPELAAFLRTDLGRPAALYLAATALHGASTTEMLPFSPDFIQKYAERTQFANVYEVSSMVSDSVLGVLKMTVFGHLSDLHDKVEGLAQRHGVVKTVFESVEEVSADEVVLENAVEVKS